MPVPTSGESRTDFISRCVSKVIEDGTAEDGDQAIAICISMWDNRKGGNMEREYKTFPATVVGVDEEQGIVETIFAVFGNIDEGLDIVHPGSFTKTFVERGLKVKVLDHHNAHSILDVIGKPIELRELGHDELPPGLLEKYPEATGGAYSKVQMLMDTPEGRGAFVRLKEKAVDEWSFGFDVLDSDYSKAIKNDKNVTVRNLRTIKLYELSPVIWGMNSATTTLGAKGTEDAPPVKTAEDIIQERKQTLVETLRAALIEAEALLAGSPAPADNAGGDDDADDSPAGPTVQSPTAEETERVRLELLSQIESFEED